MEETGACGAVEARELGAVLAYLQREVPSLVALPPNELRSLVLQVTTAVLHTVGVEVKENKRTKMYAKLSVDRC